MREGKVLLLVEGKKSEPELLQHFYNLYNKSNIKIVAYETNLYALYHRLKKDYAGIDGQIEYEYIDLPLFLNDYLKLKGEKRLKSNDFRDILLVFDFDPQDSSYSQGKLMELIENFSNSTELGKLYINYPMVESFKDITSFQQDEFNRTTVSFSDIKRKEAGTSSYKEIVSSRSCIPKLTDITKEMGRMVIALHSRKLNELVSGNFAIDEKYKELCELQCKKLASDNEIWIINTSIIHFLYEYGEL